MTLRERQREEGRRIVRDAALHLFLEQGYVGTTVQAIAGRAGVAERTVYNLFESKPALLLDIILDRVAGAPEASLAADHSHLEILTDPTEMIHYYGEITRRVAGRALPLLKIAHQAALVDREVAKLLTAQEEDRLDRQTLLLNALSRKGHLRDDVPFEYLRIGFWLLASPETALKAADAGWDLDTYTKWFTEALQALLLHRTDETRR